MYKVHTWDKHVFLVDDDEANAVMEAKNRGEDVFLEGSYIAASNISGVYPDDTEDRHSQTQGILHDGCNAVRQFGRWVDPEGPMDDRGNYLVSYDLKHYPECAYDKVPTPQEFQKYFAHLPQTERLVKMMGGQDQYARLTGKQEMLPISDTLTNAFERIDEIHKKARKLLPAV